jgi:hypothetical protein
MNRYHQPGNAKRNSRRILLLLVAALLSPPLAASEDISNKYSPDTGSHFYKWESDTAKIKTRCEVYVPAYSHIYLTEKGRALLAVTLSIRNVNAKAPLIISKIEYFDTKGELVDKLISGTFGLAPMATASFVIEQKDARGGAGANFIVEWASQTEGRRPIIETIMAGYVGTRGLSFSSRGVELDCTRPR